MMKTLDCHLEFSSYNVLRIISETWLMIMLYCIIADIVIVVRPIANTFNSK